MHASNRSNVGTRYFYNYISTSPGIIALLQDLIVLHRTFIVSYLWYNTSLQSFKSFTWTEFNFQVGHCLVWTAALKLVPQQFSVLTIQWRTRIDQHFIIWYNSQDEYVMFCIVSGGKSWSWRGQYSNLSLRTTCLQGEDGRIWNITLRNVQLLRCRGGSPRNKVVPL